MYTINTPYKGFAGFILDGKTTIIGAVEANQQFDCIDGVEMFFGKTLAELNTALEAANA
jgi:hypothetical protein